MNNKKILIKLALISCSIFTINYTTKFNLTHAMENSINKSAEDDDDYILNPPSFEEEEGEIENYDDKNNPCNLHYFLLKTKKEKNLNNNNITDLIKDSAFDDYDFEYNLKKAQETTLKDKFKEQLIKTGNDLCVDPNESNCFLSVLNYDPSETFDNIDANPDDKYTFLDELNKHYKKLILNFNANILSLIYDTFTDIVNNVNEFKSNRRHIISWLIDKISLKYKSKKYKVEDIKLNKDDNLSFKEDAGDILISQEVVPLKFQENNIKENLYNLIETILKSYNV